MSVPSFPGLPEGILPAGYGIPRDVGDSSNVYVPEPGVAPRPSSPGYVVARTDIDADALQQDLAQALGRDVAIVARAANITTGQAGVLWIKSAASGIEINADPTLVEEIINSHEPPETEQARFLREYDAAPDADARLTAYRDHIARTVAEEQRQAVLLELGRRRLAALTPRVSGRAPQPARVPVPPPIVSRNPALRQ